LNSIRVNLQNTFTKKAVLVAAFFV
jgi:hypothetical protein